MNIGFHFLSTSKTFYLELGNLDDSNFQIALDLVESFGGRIDDKEHVIHLDALQTITEEMKERIRTFVEKYIRKNKDFHLLRDAILPMGTGKYFLFFPSNKQLDTEISSSYLNYLHSVEGNCNFDEMQKIQDEILGCVLKNYNMDMANGDKDFYFGMSKNKICRYCGKNGKETKFKKKGHTISESLGNKCIITRDECDTCNAEFGEGIEKNIAEYFNIMRTNFGIKGKKGIPQIIGKNFELINTGNESILKFYPRSEDESKKFPWAIPCAMHGTINEQDIYRTLCKYAIGMMPTEILHNFKETIDWVRKKSSKTKLPKIAELLNYSFFNKHPSIVLYIRKSNDTELPLAVCELHFTCFTLVYIIPTFLSGDDFSEEIKYQKFWNCFHYKKVTGWKFQDFANDSPRDVVVTLNFHQHNSANE